MGRGWVAKAGGKPAKGRGVGRGSGVLQARGRGQVAVVVGWGWQRGWGKKGVWWGGASWGRTARCARAAGSEEARRQFAGGGSARVGGRAQYAISKGALKAGGRKQALQKVRDPWQYNLKEQAESAAEYTWQRRGTLLKQVVPAAYMV